MAEQSPTNTTPEPASTGKPKTDAGSNSIFDDISVWATRCGEDLRSFGKWCAQNPAGGVLAFSCIATFLYFYACVRLFQGDVESTLQWGIKAWHDDQAHSWLVTPIAIALIWYRRDALREAPKQPSSWGIVPIVMGVLLFIASARSIQPRIGLFSIPFLLFGSILFLYGKKVARIVLFPCAFLVFLIPLGAMEQATAILQVFATQAVASLSHIVGIPVTASGTTLSGGSFNFEIAEGCSGIRSLMAMVMITSIYVHLTQNRLWKKIVVFGCSAVFATIGNIGRIFSIVLVGKFIDPKFAGTTYHDYSDFVFFPAAILAMILFGRLVNFDLSALLQNSAPAPRKAVRNHHEQATVAPTSKAGSYDY